MLIVWAVGAALCLHRIKRKDIRLEITPIKGPVVNSKSITAILSIKSIIYLEYQNLFDEMSEK